VRLCWLKSVCAVAEGADVPLSRAVPEDPSRCLPDVCVAAVLGDALQRVAVLGGRDGMPRSLGSVYGGAVTRFLGGGLVLDVSCVIEMRVVAGDVGLAVSRDGSTLLATDMRFGSSAIHVCRVADGSWLRVVGSKGRGPLQFRSPYQVHVAPDGFVFVADFGNDRVQVLTPTLDFHGYIGESSLDRPVGVCANADVVVVSEAHPAPHISVFDQRDGSLLRRFGTVGSGDGELDIPRGLCFVDDDRHVAVADSFNDRVSVFSVDGQFIRHVGVGMLRGPCDIACTAFDELVVADRGNGRVAVFSASGDAIVASAVDGGCAGVAVHGSTVFALPFDKPRCVVLTWSTR
jgi:DNA-binding beta-propeller fold protein YncE